LKGRNKWHRNRYFLAKVIGFAQQSPVPGHKNTNY